MKKIKKISSLLLCFSFTFISLYADQDPRSLTNQIPKEVIFGNPEKASPKISPDGTKMAYLAPDAKNVLNVWVKDLFDKKEDYQVTSDKKRGISQFFWEYGSERILYVQDKDGDENWHLYQTHIESKLTRNLTPFDGATLQIVAYEPQFPDQMLIGLNIQNPALFDVYRLNLKNGAIDKEVDNVKNAISWVADSNLLVRAFSYFDDQGGTIIEVRDSIKDPWREFMKWTFDDGGTILGFSPDGHFLYMTSSIHENTEKLFKIHLKTKEKTLLAQDADYDISTEALVHPTSHELEAIGVYREKFEWIPLDTKIKADLTFLQKKKEETKILSRDLKDKNWIVMHLADNHPAHYSLYNRETQELKFLFSEKPKMEKYALTNMHPISFTARDGMQIHGYLSLPLGKNIKNRPTVLLVHGGPWVRDTWKHNSYVQWLTNRGYATLQINYRGSTGYGKRYLNAGNREWAGKMQTDLLDGKKWMIDQGYADPKKVAIFGGSYGGYATLVGLTFTPEEFCCGVDIVGPSNLVTLLQTIPPYWGPMRSIFDKRLASLDTEKEFLESISPLFKVDKICRPLLIAQGANDPRVKQAESDQIVKVLQDQGKEVEYILFADEGHGFKRPENQLKFIEAAEAFLEKHLKNVP